MLKKEHGTGSLCTKWKKLVILGMRKLKSTAEGKKSAQNLPKACVC